VVTRNESDSDSVFDLPLPPREELLIFELLQLQWTMRCELALLHVLCTFLQAAAMAPATPPTHS
jgi:hypothetical protein